MIRDKPSLVRHAWQAPVLTSYLEAAGHRRRFAHRSHNQAAFLSSVGTSSFSLLGQVPNGLGHRL